MPNVHGEIEKNIAQLRLSLEDKSTAGPKTSRLQINALEVLIDRINPGAEMNHDQLIHFIPDVLRLPKQGEQNSPFETMMFAIYANSCKGG